MDYETEQLYDHLTETSIATEEEISLVTSIIGWNLESLESILYVRTGYRGLDQINDAQ